MSRRHKKSDRRWLRTGVIAVVGVAVAGGVGYGAVQVSKQLVPKRTFYVSATGSDTNSGRTADRPWKTLGPVNDEELRPGDHVYLDPSATFTGSLRLDADDAGDSENPVVISSTGSGRATIAPEDGPAIVVLDTAGVEIRNLVLRGPDSPDEEEAEDGLRVVSNRTDDERLRGITVSGIESSGFRNGITVTATKRSGFEDVTISDSEVHDNINAGLSTSGPGRLRSGEAHAHRNVVIRNVRAHHNAGDPLARQNTGSGIVLGSVEKAIVTESTAHENGGDSNTTEGPVGIWAYDADQVLFERNLSYRNLTRGADGGGFDFDEGVTNSVMQYNLSHDNHSYGYLMYTNAAVTGALNNTIRYNVSVNDSSSGTQFYGSITLLGGLAGPNTQGGIREVSVYNNTVVASPTPAGAPSAFLIGGTVEDVVVANNAFIVNGPNPLLTSIDADPGTIRFVGNSYTAPPGAFVINWGGVPYVDLEGWRAASTQETLGPVPTGVLGGQVIDAAVADITDVNQLGSPAGLRPVPGSPLIGGGVDLKAGFGIDLGERDYFGTPIARDRWDIGAAVPE